MIFSWKGGIVFLSKLHLYYQIISNDFKKLANNVHIRQYLTSLWEIFKTINIKSINLQKSYKNSGDEAFVILVPDWQDFKNPNWTTFKIKPKKEDY